MTVTAAEGLPRKRRRYAARLPFDARREQLLDAALAVATHEGLQGVTMEAVARQAGVTKPVVYGVFANADELLGGLVDRELARAMEHVLAAIPSEIESAEPTVVAEAGLKAYLGAVREHPDTWRLLLAQEGLPAAARARYDQGREWIQTSVNALAAWGLANRRGGDLDAELTGHLIFAGAEMGARLILRDPEQFSEERLLGFVSELVRSVLEG